MKAYFLTTKDNPFDPFDDFDKWYNFDVNIAGYNCLSYVARLAITSPAFSDEANNRIINNAIDRILEIDPNPMYMKVVKEIDE